MIFRRVSFFIGLLLLLAMLVSGWLLSSVVLSASAGTCESGCDELVHGPWGKFAGVPVSAVGLALYAILFWVNARPVWKPGLLLGRLTSGLVLGAAVWFTGLQIWLGQFCPYCCFIHVCAVTAVVIWLRGHWTPAAAATERSIPPLSAVSAGAVLVLLLVTVQVVLREKPAVISEQAQNLSVARDSQTPPTTASGPNSAAPERELVLHGGRFRISSTELPVLGSPQANQMAALLFDFTCPHCRQMHAEVATRLDHSDVAAVLLPVPRNAKAAAIHRLMLALWREQPSAYEEIAHRMISGQLVATEVNVRREIAAAIGEAALTQRLATDSVWIQGQIDRAQAVRVANHPQKTLGIPQLMVGGEVLVGFDSPRVLAQFLADNAGLRPHPASSEVEIEVVAAPPSPSASPIPDSGSGSERTTSVPAPSASQPPTRIPLVMSAAPLRRERVQVVLINVAGTDAETVNVKLPASLADLGVTTQTGSRTSSGKVPVRLSFPKGFQAPEDSQAIQIDASDGSRSSTLVAIERAE